ncbi:hypothetical protein A2565_02800 [Candidatus Nomurabacteria bacterium RIFOXYD1_FULL_36_19]|nr:MAG: hypothetical protein A2565_02800 [Candidatus Nomurabacteria bacterium RIFOXYD1_FULL_36_19]
MPSFIVDMNNIVVGLGDLYNNGYLGYKNKILLSKTGKDRLDISENAYWDIKKSLDSTSLLYKSLSSSNSNEDINNLIEKSLDTAKGISNAVKLAQSSFDYTSNFFDDDTSSSFVDTQTNLTAWSTSVNSYVNTLSVNLSNIKEITLSINDTIEGADELDIRQAQLNVETKQNALSDYFVTAPFDGIVATLTAKVGQSASGSIGTLIAKQKLVKIALNEVDIAKIKLGQKATLTFDAIDGLTITGTVEGIDSVGTVSQGVVTYNVSVSLDTDDVRIKPGMSVSATIIINTTKDVVVVPNSAIKTGRGVSYVEVFSSPLMSSNGEQGSTSNTLPSRVPIKIGLSDDTSTEILSGLKEGDIIVAKTITSTTSKTTSSAPSIFGAVGGSTRTGTGGGSGTMRAVTGH